MSVEGIQRRRERVIRAIPGTHELVVNLARRYVIPGGRALDLGAWSGALVERLLNAGFEVTGADIANCFELDTRFVQVDLNDPNFDRALEPEFDFISAVEVIEHLENPTAFLRSIGRLLRKAGIAVVTTPNVENVPARLKFLLRGKVRGMDENSPEHITPIHLDLFRRKIVPVSGLVLLDHFVYPANDFPLTGRAWIRPFLHALLPFLRGPALTGDTHVFTLTKPQLAKADGP